MVPIVKSIVLFVWQPPHQLKTKLQRKSYIKKHIILNPYSQLLQ
jgi:hypothetical protein